MAKKSPNYEAAFAELESIVSQVESGTLPIAQLSTQLQRAQTLLALCQAQLLQVEQEVKTILENAEHDE